MHVAAVNAWDNETKLLWLKARLTGLADTALKTEVHVQLGLHFLGAVLGSLGEKKAEWGLYLQLVCLGIKICITIQTPAV